MIDVARLRGWIGREELTEDVASPAPLAGLAATLDHDAPPWPEGELPPLGHWLYFLPRARQSALDTDGHARRGGFLPPVPLPRRMWAGGALSFHAAIPVGAPIVRRSTIAEVVHKHGASGDLVFVTVAHEISAGGVLAVRERQDLVYRGAAGAAAAEGAPPPERPADSSRTLSAGPALLFRFSALTFNAHRIHYDRDYARDAEGYDGLVVQGPLLAILLVDLLLRAAPGRRLSGFSFRARRPLLDTAPFRLCQAGDADGADLWTRDSAGHETMTARATW